MAQTTTSRGVLAARLASKCDCPRCGEVQRTPTTPASFLAALASARRSCG